MTPIERLQAAIEKLERYTEESWHPDTESPLAWLAINGENPGGGRNVTGTMARDDAELILTLHRTIDAQLSLLRHAEKFLATVGHHTSNIAGPFIDDALALADAILGSDS